MFYVPLYVEALRSRPRLVFWLAVLAQAILWVAVPALLYSAPPGDLAHLLAVAHDLPLRVCPAALLLGRRFCVPHGRHVRRLFVGTSVCGRGFLLCLCPRPRHGR